MGYFWLYPQELLLMGAGESYEMLGIEPGEPLCKARALLYYHSANSYYTQHIIYLWWEHTAIILYSFLGGGSGGPSIGGPITEKGKCYTKCVHVYVHFWGYISRVRVLCSRVVCVVFEYIFLQSTSHSVLGGCSQQYSENSALPVIKSEPPTCKNVITPLLYFSDLEIH